MVGISNDAFGAAIGAETAGFTTLFKIAPETTGNASEAIGNAGAPKLVIGIPKDAGGKPIEAEPMCIGFGAIGTAWLAIIGEVRVTS